MVSTADIAWAAGFLEGEGYFQNPKTNGGPKVTACQVNPEPLERLQSIFGGKIHRITKPARTTQQPITVWTAHGTRGAEVIFTVFPFLSQRRRSQAASALKRWRSRAPSYKYRTHCNRGHRYAGINLLVRIRVSTRAFRQCRECRIMWQRQRREREALKRVRPSP